MTPARVRNMPTQHTQLSVIFCFFFSCQLYRYYVTVGMDAYGTVNLSKAEKLRQELELLGGISLGL